MNRGVTGSTRTRTEAVPLRPARSRAVSRRRAPRREIERADLLPAADDPPSEAPGEPAAGVVVRVALRHERRVRADPNDPGRVDRDGWGRSSSELRVARLAAGGKTNR